MSHCLSNIAFSSTRSNNRINMASSLLGDAVVKRLLAFALFLMGAKREDIASCLSIPLGTLFSVLTRITQLGLPAIEDRRRAASQFLPVARRRTHPASASLSKDNLVVDFGVEGQIVQIPTQNMLQIKTFLLSLLHNGLLSRSEVASILGYSSDHTARLAQQLAVGDVHALLDKREGQKADYRVTPAIKAELIQQFAADVVAHRRTSSNMISTQLKDRCNISLPSRTLRHHLAQMALPTIKRSLPQLIESLKKTPRTTLKQESRIVRR